LQREVTQRHRMEAQLRRAQKLEALGRLATGIAHEINNPLAFVIANLQYVREALDLPAAELARAPLDELAAALAEACVGGDRIKQIVRDLKAFAQPHDESLAVVDVRPLVEFSLKIASAELRGRARVVTRFDDVPAVWGISGRLEQVFVNLLINAAHAIEPGALERNEIRVAVRAAGDDVVVEISDTGAGIAPANLERIFDPFFTTKPVGVGTGLGLSICHSIVTAFGGELAVESEQGKGSTFRVTLPVARAGADSGPTRVPVLHVSDAARLLIVDADPAVAKAARRALPGHKIVAAADGFEALALCRQQPFDLVLYDARALELSAPDMFRELCEAGGGLEQRLVMTHAGTLAPELARLVEEHGIPCLDAPVEARDVERLVRRADP
jgi:two-component system, cell cycle sensor histidine kinase and response regulator CckA